MVNQYLRLTWYLPPGIVLASKSSADLVETIHQECQFSFRLSLMKNGAELVEAARKNEADVILIDDECGDLPGVDVCSRIRSLGISNEPTLILMVDEKAHREIIRAAPLPPDYVVAKSSAPRVLEKILLDALRLRFFSTYITGDHDGADSARELNPHYPLSDSIKEEIAFTLKEATDALQVILLAVENCQFGPAFEARSLLHGISDEQIHQILNAANRLQVHLETIKPLFGLKEIDYSVACEGNMPHVFPITSG